MVDLDWKNKTIGCKDQMSSNHMPAIFDGISPPSGEINPMIDDLMMEPSPVAAAAYEQYLRLHELTKLWNLKEWPRWRNESLVKPTLHGLEFTFRLISLIFSDSRLYLDKSEWRRRMEALADHEIELIAALCEEEVVDDHDEEGTILGTDTPVSGAPTVDLGFSNGGVLRRDGSSQEVWSVRGKPMRVLVSRGSEQSLLPRLRSWKKTEEQASRIALSIECHMQRSLFTLGLGEPNLEHKPILEYDLICKPGDLDQFFKRNPYGRRIDNPENQTLYTVHQILEAWLFSGRELVKRIDDLICRKEWEKAAKDAWLLERLWKLLAEIEDLHLLMDPDDFLRLKTQLSIGGSPAAAGFFLRSRSLLALTRSCKDLKHQVPAVLGVEVDPRGGPRVQKAAMKLFHRHGEVKTESESAVGIGRIHLLQAVQAVEAAVKRFYFGYHQVITVVMGSVEVRGSVSSTAVSAASDPLSQIFLEPPYFPSLDAARTFLGDFWLNEHRS